MARNFVIGDIHGAQLALKQCLERSRFDYTTDHLICLGDVCDGWPDTKAAVEQLLTLGNLTYILGNHDLWALNWMETGQADDIWLSQGGNATVQSYSDGVPQSHLMLLKKAKTFYRLKNSLFVHAGILPGKEPEETSMSILLWDRTLVHLALEQQEKGENTKLTQFDEVFVGHTPIVSSHPVKWCEVWMMDTGAGWSGVLSMMNVETKEFFVSDPVPGLYPNAQGRKRF